MSAPDEGGQAFPGRSPVTGGPEKGMTLRKWYAGQAMAGRNLENKFGDLVDEEEAEEIASAAFKVADAMIAEEKKEASDG